MTYIFYASATITMVNRGRTPFWDSPWLNGKKPKEIAPLIYGCSTRKNWKVKDVTKDNAWIVKIKIPNTMSMDHIREFISR